ncbi:MAG: hypothetical protein PHI98_00415 [Eubacteriales bacterium]|nr:hypothetical protein [Eubacteriales bacterium]
MDGRTLPGFQKKSFALFYSGAELWCEHLDGLYGFGDLALEKLEQDYAQWKKPSRPGLMAVNLDETVLDDSLLSALAQKLLNGEKRLTRVVFVGVKPSGARQLQKRLGGANFAVAFENDYEKAKEWLVSQG